MLSRAADSVYWMHRYLERADNVARFVDVNIHLMLDLGISAEEAQWSPLVATSGDHELFAERYVEASEANVIRFLTFDEENPNSVISCIRLARENARTVREIISTEMWRLLNELHHYVQAESRKARVDDLREFYGRVRSANHLFTGIAENTCSREEALRFGAAGRCLERADKTARILDVKYFLLLPAPDYIDSPLDAVQWGAVLKSVQAFEMYRKRYHRINYKNVAAFLLFDRAFPRSLAFCAEEAGRAISLVAAGSGREEAVRARIALKGLQSMLEGGDAESVIRGGLHEFIDAFQAKLNAADSAICRAFFRIPSPEPRAAIPAAGGTAAVSAAMMAATAPASSATTTSPAAAAAPAR